MFSSSIWNDNMNVARIISVLFGFNVLQCTSMYFNVAPNVELNVANRS